MARRKSSQDDITKVGLAPLQGLNYQNSNNSQMGPLVSGLMRERAAHLDNAASLPYFVGNGVYNQELNAAAMESPSNPIPYGQSVYDDNTLWGDAQDVAQNYGDIRGERQPWWSKILNGIGKAGVLAVTTAAESAGLLYGIGQGIGNAIGAEDGHGGEAFLNGLWDNPITNALKTINDFSEKVMPNYYTRDEQENPFALRNMFSANTLGDKILKNLGFMVGAFYGGIPASALIGKIGTAAVKSARAASLAERAGMATRVAELTEEAGGDINKLNKLLSSEHLTEAERGKRILDGFDRVRNAAQTTRATTQVIGSLGSAINEGAIEAINNSNDWANMQKQQADAKYQQEMADIDAKFGGTEEELSKKVEAAQRYQKRLNEIEKGKVRMGNADLLLNIPILTASNMFQLGKLYSRGFDSTRRQLGTVFNGHKLEGNLAKSTLKSGRTKKQAVLSALQKSNSEGLEEYLQRAASDGAGQAVADSIDRFVTTGQSGESKNDVDDYIAGFGKAIADNLDDQSAWEEYFIGAVSSLFGMPVFGSQTKNAYIGKNMPVGIAGGFIGNYQDYMGAREREEQVAKYLNERVKDPKFKILYDNLRKTGDLDKLMEDALSEDDKAKYKELEFEKLFNDINAAASSGHLEEFKELIGYNKEYTEQELEDIVKETSKIVTADEQKKNDEQRKAYLERVLDEEGVEVVFDEDAPEEIKERARQKNDYLNNVHNELDEINQRLNDDNYQDKQEGPFINRNGAMNVQTDANGVKGGEMLDILNRNKNHILDSIDNILKIRNDIDIETDGRLDDDQIALLTQMRTKIWNYDQRSAEMAYDLIHTLIDEGVLNNQAHWKEWIKANLEKAEEKYKEVSEEYDNAKKYSNDEKEIDNLGRKKEEAEKALNKAKTASRSVDNVIKLLDMLLDSRENSSKERMAMMKGYGYNLGERIGGYLKGDFAISDINSDEAQAILANPQNTLTLLHAIANQHSGLDDDSKKRLVQEVIDLNDLANQKIKYNEKVREFLGDPKKINEAFQQANDKISQEEKDNKAEELALNIQNAETMTDLDDIMREAAQVNPDIAKSALQKAKQGADDDTKKFISDYENGVNFLGNFSRQAASLPDSIKAGVMDTVQSAWEYVLTDGVDVYDKLVGALNDAANDLEKDNNPMSKQTAEAIRGILSDLDVASRATTTNSKPKKETARKKNTKKEEKPDDSDKDLLEGLAAIRKKKEAEKKEEEEKKEEKPVVLDKDTIRKNIKNAVEDSLEGDNFRIAKIADLPENIRKQIEDYNEANDEKIDDNVMAEILNELADDVIKDDEDYDIDKDDNTEVEDAESSGSRSVEMKANLSVSFKSDHPTEFSIDRDYRTPYNPTDKQLQAVQKLLQQLKAYQFVDKNYLGYVVKESDEPVKIHFLKSTDKSIDGNGGSDAIIFLAIKWGDKVESAIRKNAFGGKMDANISDEASPVTVNGEQYQIVGVLSMSTTVSQEVAKAFGELQSAINGELNPQMDDARNNGQQFVVSSLTTQVDTVYTGRLDKMDTDKENKVSLYDFMTSQNEDGRRTSTEWDNGMDFYFGAVINDFFRSDASDAVSSDMVLPNDQWMSTHNGHIVMFVPRPDGKLYPVRVTRRTVGDWLKKTADGSHTGEELLKGVLDGTVSNAFIEDIVHNIKKLLDTNASIGERVQAKVRLSKYFIFGKGNSPIGFDGAEVTLRFGDESHIVDGDNENDMVLDFFNTLASNNIMFTLPIGDKNPVNGREVIKSGIFEIGLKGFYNFNANFTIAPIDGNGDPVIVNPERSDAPSADNIRSEEVEFDLGDGLKKYTINGDGTITLDGEPVDTDTANIITLAIQAEQGNLPAYISTILNERYKKSAEVRDYIANNMTKFDGIYTFVSNGITWIYDGRKGNHDIRLYKINSEQGKKIMSDINKAIIEFTTENITTIKGLKKSRNTNNTTTERTSPGTYYRIDRENSALQRNSKEGSNLIVDDEGRFQPVGSWTNLQVASNLSKFFKVVDENDKPVARQLWSKATGYEVVYSGQFGNDDSGVRQVKEKGTIKLIGISNKPVSSTSSSKRFSGKTIAALKSKSNTRLEQLLIANEKSPLIKKVFKALQEAEDAGIAIDDEKTADLTEDVLSKPKEEMKKALADLLEEIKRC